MADATHAEAPASAELDEIRQLRARVAELEAAARAADSDTDRSARRSGALDPEDGPERTEHASVREAEAKFQAFFDHAPLGKSMTAPDGRLLRVNRAFGHMLGYAVEDMQGVSFREITHPDDLEESLLCVRSLLAGERDDHAMEKRYLGRDGQVVWTHITTRLHRDGDGRPLFFLTHVQDITEARRVRQALERSEEDFRLLFEAMPIGWAEHEAIFDEAGVAQDYVFLRANSAFERFTGLMRETIIGRRVTEVIPGIREAEPDLVPLYGEVARTGVSQILELYFAPLDRWYRVTVFRQHPGRFITMFEDISGRKRAELIQQQLNDDLVRSNNELEQFAYVASHDLQEPLRMVASFTQLLAERYEGQLDDEADKYIRYAIDGARRMQDLVNDLLSLSRIGTRGPPPGPTDCEVVAHEVVAQLASHIAEHGAEVEIGPLPTIVADRTQFSQLLQNLIANAVKFHGEAAPRVKVSARRAGDFWEFTVADNGVGIDPQFHERIFVIFQRLHERGRYKGNGIGLSIAKKIVERHGGRIWVDSVAGEGARFSFTMPFTTVER